MERTVFIPAGRHEISWQLQTLYRGRNSGGTYLSSGGDPGMQAWVKGISVKSARAFYQEWAREQELTDGLSDPNDDADGDGASNLMEYAFGTDAMERSEKPGMPFGRVVPDQSYTISVDGRFFTHTSGPVHHYHVPFVSHLVHGVIETSPDLVVWTEHSTPIAETGSEWGYLTLIPDIPYVTTTHHVLPTPVVPGQPRFFRMSLKLPE